MPRLGDSSGNDGRGSGLPTTRAPATAYPISQRQSTMWRILYILSVTLIMRNIFFNNYKKDAVTEMVKDGVISSKEAEDMFHPATKKTRSQLLSERKAEIETLKLEVKNLKAAVAKLEEVVGTREQVGGEIEKKDDIHMNSNNTTGGEAVTIHQDVKE